MATAAENAERSQGENVKRELIPTEAREQQTVAMWLDYHKIFWFHYPSEFFASDRSQRSMKRFYGQLAKLKAAGWKKGVPDILIFDPPPAYRDFALRGAVIEMKRVKGGVVSEEQQNWLTQFQGRRWAIASCAGADAAIAQLEAWGYGK